MSETSEFDIPTNGNEVDRFAPHEYEENDVVYIVTPEQTMIFTFSNKPGQPYQKTYGRPAYCKTNVKDGNGMWSMGESVYMIGDSLVTTDSDGAEPVSAYYGPIQRIVHVPAPLLVFGPCPCS